MTEIKETVENKEYISHVHIPYKVKQSNDIVRVEILKMKKNIYCDSCGAKFDHQPEKCSGCGRSNMLREMS
jgi:hypothetical protein